MSRIRGLSILLDSFNTFKFNISYIWHDSNLTLHVSALYAPTNPEPEKYCGGVSPLNVDDGPFNEARAGNIDAVAWPHADM